MKIPVMNTQQTKITDSGEKAVKKFSNHPSILKVKDYGENAGRFAFQKVVPDAVYTVVTNSNPKKATTQKMFLPKSFNSMLIGGGGVDPLTQIFNYCMENSTFTAELKFADVTSLPKNEPTNTRTNFRTISLLPTASKQFERIMDSCSYHTFLILTALWFSKSCRARHALVRL